MKKRINIKEEECPMYEIGYCKNGPLCKYKHNNQYYIKYYSHIGKGFITPMVKMPKKLQKNY